MARMEESLGVYRILVGKPGNLEDSGVDGRVILRWIFRKWDLKALTRSICLRIGAGDEDL